jgi:dolichyl-phosphate-mannose--protein O-mannosyl transferase
MMDHGFFHRLVLTFALLVCIFTNSHAQLGTNAPRDAALHFGISAGITFVSCRIISYKFPAMNLTNKYLLSGGIGLAVGVGKEFVDLATTGLFDFYDIVFDMWGISAGLLLHYLIFDKKNLRNNLSLQISDRQFGASYRFYF